MLQTTKTLIVSHPATVGVFAVDSKKERRRRKAELHLPSNFKERVCGGNPTLHPNQIIQMMKSQARFEIISVKYYHYHSLEQMVN